MNEQETILTLAEAISELPVGYQLSIAAGIIANSAETNPETTYAVLETLCKETDFADLKIIFGYLAAT